MAVSTLSTDFAAVSARAAFQRRAKPGASPVVLRSLLVISCLACALVAAAVGESKLLVRADPQLAWLLRGMALIKSTLVLAALAVIWWRFTHPVRAEAALAYVLGAAMLAGATTLIWQLSLIPLAALSFHVAVFMILITAWRDEYSGFKSARRAT